MSSNEDARQLLADSYFASAQRIMDAMDGSLVIRNSSRPDRPPSAVGEIVGLCGQGGRHAYFRIPQAVLKAALIRILSAMVLPVALRMEEITVACQDLRQNTSFDTGTGCVNDKLPSMVPLLPPEEIWLDDRELPLDVWRFVSFDFDLVSASVSSEISTDDFAFSAVNQNALAFRVLLKTLGNRRTTFELEVERIPATWGLGSSKRTMDISLARVFCEAGALLTPLASDDFTQWYGAVRYLHWLDEVSQELRVKDEFKQHSVDSRYRGLFAEETSIGLMAIVLADLFKAAPILNAVEYFPKASIDPGQPIADFVAQAVDPNTLQKVSIIAESKGSLGKVVSAGRLERAKEQLTQTKKIPFAGTSQQLALAFASTIRFSGQRLKSRCLVADPPADFEPGSIEIDPTQAWRVAFAKALRFVGLEIAAQQVARGDPATGIRPIDFDRQLDRKRNDRDRRRLRRALIVRERLQMDLILDLGPYALGIDTSLLAILQRGINTEAQYQIPEILMSHRQVRNERMRGASFETSLGLGCISYAELDEDERF